MLGRERLPDGAAGRVADEMRTLDLEMVHHRHKVIRHLIDGIADARAGAAAGAAMIVHDRLVAR